MKTRRGVDASRSSEVWLEAGTGDQVGEGPARRHPGLCSAPASARRRIWIRRDLGPIDELPPAKVESFKKYRALLTEEAIAAADPRHGKQVFAKACLSCHKMYGEGGEIGPDITGANRGDLNYVLENLLDPSEEIPEGYQLNVITTRDGRNYGGTVASESDAQLVLRQAAGDPVMIEKSDIQSREKLDVSMMPEGLLTTLKDDEVVALVRYLRTAEPLK